MNKTLRTGLTAAVSLLLCVFFIGTLLRYTRPVGDTVYDLSMQWEGEAMPQNWVYDQKGWTVFVQDGEQRTELDADGMGGFYGDFQPGQTFYFSRVMTEELNNPEIRLETFYHSIAVFLDGELIYSDSPEAGSRIGELNLSDLAWMRADTLNVALPEDYLGKTLTIAQSSDPFNEFQTAMPCQVTLYCGFSYESRLIAESFGIAVAATICLAVGIFLLVLFVVQARQNHTDIGVFGATLISFLWMSRILSKASFFESYWEKIPEDWTGQLELLTLVVLLVVLSVRAGRFRVVAWGLTWVYAFACMLRLAVDMYTKELSSWLLSFLWEDFPNWTGAAALLVILLLAWSFWRRQSWFYRIYAPLETFGLAAVLLFALLTQPKLLQSQLGLAVTDGHLVYFLYPMIFVSTAAALISLAADLIQRRLGRRAEAEMMAGQVRAAFQDYEELRVQHEEAQMLKQDMVQHLQALQQMTAEPQTAAYVQELIHQTERDCCVLQSGNDVLDVILNGKLALAKEQGTEVEIVQAQAPQKLPMPDAQLCSVMMNLMNNALDAARDSRAERPFIRLDLHMKKDIFVFCCENSVPYEMETGEEKTDDRTLPEHGYGLKSVQKILKACGGLYKAECADGVSRVRFTLRCPEDQGMHSDSACMGRGNRCFRMLPGWSDRLQ